MGQTHPEHYQQGQQNSRLHTKEPPRLHMLFVICNRRKIKLLVSCILYLVVPVKAATYTAMVRPSLEYASTVWDTPNQAHIKYSAELPDTYIMTTTAEHQHASPRWWKTSTGNRSQPEERQICFQRCIVRPVKRDWAVLSKDTPMDISISKSVRQCVFIHL